MMPSDTYLEKLKTEMPNMNCACVTLNSSAVQRNLNQQLGDTADEILTNSTIRQFFSNVAVFVPRSELEKMQSIVSAIHSTVALPQYQQKVLSWAPETARHNPGPEGAFMGFDFHLGEDGPQLIEINTNAGGAFLNAVLARAQSNCCSNSVRAPWAENFDGLVLAQFLNEWRLQRGTTKLNRLAIVDDAPEEQHLYPEFILAQRLLNDNGIDTVILSPADLRYEAGVLYGDNQPIDMVYNRLVDFALERPENAPLRSAWIEDAAVITPNPYTHAIYADKRNLEVLSNQHSLRNWGFSTENSLLLQEGVPHTVQVTDNERDMLWKQRRQWFFKPVAGHGSKGVYRGSKLTKSTFARILESEYVAQALVTPSERMVLVDGERKMLKVDVRLYTYGGSLLLAAARLYQGQTTNLRTPGGGFAPILIQGN